MSCVATIHVRFVPNDSTIGLQSGFIVHGKYSKLVQNVNDATSTSMFLYIKTDVVMTIEYGTPW